MFQTERLVKDYLAKFLDTAMTVDYLVLSFLD